jgi:hypothetical protein
MTLGFFVLPGLLRFLVNKKTGSFNFVVKPFLMICCNHTFGNCRCLFQRQAFAL